MTDTNGALLGSASACRQSLVAALKQVFRTVKSLFEKFMIERERLTIKSQAPKTEKQ
ncbi:MAG: hypothetical protein J5633_07650 [Oscillospiraceae bacterium]|nr:hypothetical protein [Oscillospiraceae bacterium]